LKPSSGLSFGIKRPTNKSRRLILSHVGGANGFVEKAIDLFPATKKAIITST